MFKEIDLANPEYLWFLILIPVVILWEYTSRFNKYPNLKLSSLKGFKSEKSFLVKFRPFIFILRVFAITLIIIALSRPQIVQVSTKSKINRGIDIVMAIDVSSSMLAQDLKPNRLVALKRVASEFMDDRLSDRIGLVVYAGESYT